MNNTSLLLDASDVRALAERVGKDALMDELISRLTDAIRLYDPEVSQIPARDGVCYEKPEWGLLEWMPAHFGEAGTTVKLVGYHPGNPLLRGLPTVVSTICVFDTTSGHLLGLVDGTFLTALRTGAASAIASRILARPECDTLGVIGCGAQSVTQIHALSRCFEIRKVIAHDIDPEAAASLRKRIGFLDLTVEIVERDSLPDLLTASDILCTCTSAPPGEGPVFSDFNNRKHLHINAVGSDFHGKFEVPIELLRRSLVCPDFREQAVAEGECQQLASGAIGPDLRTLVQDEDAYLHAQGNLTVFDSTGWALEDHVAASMLLDYAREMKRGRNVAFECLPPDAKNPYSFLRREAACGEGEAAPALRADP